MCKDVLGQGVGGGRGLPELTACNRVFRFGRAVEDPPGDKLSLNRVNVFSGVCPWRDHLLVGEAVAAVPSLVDSAEIGPMQHALARFHHRLEPGLAFYFVLLLDLLEQILQTPRTQTEAPDCDSDRQTP